MMTEKNTSRREIAFVLLTGLGNLILAAWLVHQVVRGGIRMPAIAGTPAAVP